VNYKAGGKHWVLDSGCSQHMTGNDSMSLMVITQGQELLVWVELQLPKIYLSLMFCLLSLLVLICYPLHNYVILD
jgi:hypothetical protein